MYKREIDASVIVCTYNRAESLRRTLDRILRQKVDNALSWEVIVVDNNSTDHTYQVVEDAKREAYRLVVRYEFEKKQGLSHARNRGLASSHGKLILFTDDDVSPDPNWLNVIVNSMAEYDCDACGGWIGPVWEEAPPPWLTDRFYGFLALRVDEDGPKLVTNVRDAPFGANMAFRKSIFDRFGLFATDRGRIGNRLWSGEDGEFFQRLIDGGAEAMYFPQARVYHHIGKERMRKQYFRKWRFQTSYNMVRNGGIVGSRCLLGVPLYLLRQTTIAAAKAIIARLFHNPLYSLHNNVHQFLLKTDKHLYSSK